MKKILLFVLMCGFLTTSYAQKKSNFEKRAKRSSEAIADQMDLSKEQTTVIYTALLERQERNFNQLQGQDLTKEERSKIFAESHGIMVEKLSATFTKEEIKKINAILKKQQEKMRKA